MKGTVNKGLQSFFVKVLYCQHNSWQGEIQWLDAKRTRRFRSALELVALIQEAMETTKGDDHAARLRSWESADARVRLRHGETAE